MPSITTRATVGPDGMIRLDLPVGAEHAGAEVEVTVRPAGVGGRGTGRLRSRVQYPPGYRTMSDEEWKRFIEKTAGSIDDPSFARPPQPPLVDRGPIFE